MDETIHRPITVQEMLEKYQSRYDEAEARYNQDVADVQESLAARPEEKWKYAFKRANAEEDMKWMVSQLSVYECVLKDLKEILNHENS